MKMQTFEFTCWLMTYYQYDPENNLLLDDLWNQYIEWRKENNISDTIDVDPDEFLQCPYVKDGVYKVKKRESKTVLCNPITEEEALKQFTSNVPIQYG